jgi:AbrB family looped-hinge helix DNA binding protein
VATATLTSKGQTTIPREIRDFLKLKPGDKLEFKSDPASNTVVMKAANIDVFELRGILRRKGMKPYNVNERKLAIQRRARKK